jgi:hypothetical protein
VSWAWLDYEANDLRMVSYWNEISEELTLLIGSHAASVPLSSGSCHAASVSMLLGFHHHCLSVIYLVSRFHFILHISMLKLAERNCFGHQSIYLKKKMILLHALILN